jgi:hypothetical protein
LLPSSFSSLYFSLLFDHYFQFSYNHFNWSITYFPSCNVMQWCNLGVSILVVLEFLPLVWPSLAMWLNSRWEWETTKWHGMFIMSCYY